MKKIDELVSALKSNGKTFTGIVYNSDLFLVYAHDPKVASAKPQIDFCRDIIDYNLRMKQWKQMGTFLVYADKDFDKAIQNSIDSMVVVQKS
jgi:hypothetical protein